MGAVLVAAAVAAAIVCASGCLTRFDTDRPHFDACKSNVCFLFLQDEPVSFVSPSRQRAHLRSIQRPLTPRSPQHIVFASRASARQQLFPCASPASAPGGLSGSFFAVANRTVPDALCVWAGTGCTFAGLTAFLATTSASSPSHQFAAGGVLLESPARVTDTLHPSSSIIDSSLVIIGPATTGSTSSAPVAVLLRPLTASAWGLLVFILALFGVVGIAVLTVLAPGPVRWSTLFFHVIGEEEADADADAQLARGVSGGTLARGGSGGTNGSRRESLARGRLTDSDASSDGDRWGDAAADALLEKRAARATYRAALWLYRAALSAFLIMFVLFYEISVVNVLFMQNTAERLRKSTEKLSRRELGHYAVLRASAIEEIWRKTGTLAASFLLCVLVSVRISTYVS